MSQILDVLDTNPFIDGPAEMMSHHIAEQMMLVPQFANIFTYIDGYKRMDYGFDNLPVIRLYAERYTKEFESWFITGELRLDIIMPPLLEREETQKIPDILCAAVVQQFRRPSFFAKLRELIPGLNELGKRVDVDKSLAFQFDEDLVPLTQITLNFRIDLREWDEYLTKTDRTKDSPFEKVLGDLDKIAYTIRGLKEGSSTPQVEIQTQVKT